jgi:energy-converting hydrogenase Eha subunit H
VFAQGGEAAGDSERSWASVWRRPIRWLVMVHSEGLDAWCGTNQRATGERTGLCTPQEVKQQSALVLLCGLPCRDVARRVTAVVDQGLLEAANVLVRMGVVGATGFEPVTSSVSAKHREPLC